MNQRRHAFTLIEILTVIGIIAILTSLVVLGVSHVSKSTKEKATHATMENLKNIVAEREVGPGLSAIYALYPSAGTLVLNPLPAPGDVNVGGMGRGLSYLPGPPLQPQNAFSATQMTLQLLAAVPSNKTRLAQFPSNSLLLPPPGTPVGITVPFVLDAWGNPMIYCPPAFPTAVPPVAGGLAGVTYSDASNASGVGVRNITSPDGRGFWASAGPDGIFTDTVNTAPNQKPYGDDNVYSFEN